MRKRLLFGLLGLALLLGGAEQVQAGILWDFSPGTYSTADLTFIPGDPWSNQSDGQNFQDSATFGSAVTVTGMDIYTASAFGMVGASATIRISADDMGAPANDGMGNGQYLFNFTDTITAVDGDGTKAGQDNVRVHVDFTAPVVLAAGTYWFGMSGTGYELGQYGLGGPGNPEDGLMFQYGNMFQEGFVPIGDMAFRLEGNPNGGGVVPEPTTLALLGIGGVCLAGYRWRRRKLAV